MNPALLVLACFFVACGGATQGDAGPPLVPSPRAAGDACAAIPRGCPGTDDDDGCPDTMIPVGDDCALDDAAKETLATATQDALNERDLEVLRVVGPSKLCANAVRAHLEGAGVPSARIETRIDPGRSFVSFEVAVWKGVRCR